MSVEERFSKFRDGYADTEPIAKRTRSASKKVLETPKELFKPGLRPQNHTNTFMISDISNSVGMSVEERFSEFRDRCGDTEPIAKRTRSASKKVLETPKIEDYSLEGPTILDVLYEDCWRMVFDYVKLQDLVRSERVSRHWRDVVIRYLQGIHLKLTYGQIVCEENIFGKCRMIALPKLQRAIARFGPAVVTAYCSSMRAFKALSKHCPNLEEIKINLHGRIDPIRYTPFNKLRKITIFHCLFDDKDIGKFLFYPKLEELVVEGPSEMTGICLSELRTQLKTLELIFCYELEIENLISVSDRLTELTKLELNHYRLKNVHQLIDRTRKLEYLGLRSYKATYNRPQIDRLLDAICRLSMLKHLHLYNNANVDDKWLEAVGRCCKTLQTVCVGICWGVTGDGVVDLCRGAGRTLTALDVSYNLGITAEHVVKCISYCPNLEILNVRGYLRVDRDEGSVVAALRACGSRPRPLRVLLESRYAEVPMEVSAGLILDYSLRKICMCGHYKDLSRWPRE